MKLVFVIIILVISINNQVLSQEINYGVRAGLNITTFGRDVEDNEFRNSFHIGAFMQVELFEDFSIQPELIYSEQGTVLTTGENDIKVKLNYLNIPVLAKYYVDHGCYVEAGPYVSFALSRNEDSVSDLIDVSDKYKTVDAGIAFGMSYEYNDGFFTTLRINGGISNVLKNSQNDEDLFINQSVYLLSIGYKF
jgi:hypothetical protein